jgi:hypothetical protein
MKDRDPESPQAKLARETRGVLKYYSSPNNPPPSPSSLYSSLRKELPNPPWPNEEYS